MSHVSTHEFRNKMANLDHLDDKSLRRMKCLNGLSLNFLELYSNILDKYPEDITLKKSNWGSHGPMPDRA